MNDAASSQSAGVSSATASHDRSETPCLRFREQRSDNISSTNELGAAADMHLQRSALGGRAGVNTMALLL